MSVRVGITRLCNFTVEDAVRVYGIVRDAVKTIIWFKSYWKNADSFKKYRIVQAPIEIQVLVVPVVVGYLGQMLSSGGAPVNLGQLSGLSILMVLSSLVLDEIGKSRVLRRAREKWIMPDPIVAFDCVHCGLRHGAIGHFKHPPKKCKTCKTPWKDEWADYLKRDPFGGAYMDDVNPGATW
jgi:hypothetical protein